MNRASCIQHRRWVSGMARLSYDSVEALIYDPVSANRTATRAALYALGFRHTESVSTMDGLAGHHPEAAAGHCVCARRRAPVKNLCAAIQELRQGGNCGRKSLHRRHRHRLGEIHRAYQPGGQFRRRRSSAAAFLHRAAGPAASKRISNAAKALSSPPIMSAPTGAPRTEARQVPPMPKLSIRPIR